MKLIKQVSLWFKQGSSDKVYEVDLCEVRAGQFVVNFRYGRRGSNLKDGTKTAAPVPQADAQKIFDKLVESKTKKGYQHRQDSDVGAASTPAEAPTPSAAPAARASSAQSGEREQKIIERLRGGARSQSEWPLERAIWLAGQLSIAQAESILLELLAKPQGDKKKKRKYSTLWALGRCGTTSAIPAVKAEYDNASNEPHERRIAGESLRLLYNDSDRDKFVGSMTGSLPAELQGPVTNGPTEEVTRILGGILAKAFEDKNEPPFDALYRCYFIDNEYARPAVLAILQDAPMQFGYLQQIRQILKAAELRRDAEVYGILTRRFDKTRHNDWSAWYRYWGNQRRRGIRPYSVATRAYLRRRSWRNLRKLAEAGHPDYVRMAVGVLLAYNDEDAGRARSARYHRYDWNTRSYNSSTKNWPTYAGYWAFNQILYGESKRFKADSVALTFVCDPPDQAAKKAPKRREESYGHLWQQTPQALLHLIDDSNCEPVHVFACKVLRDCREFFNELDEDVAIMMLGRPYAVTADLGFELAQKFYDPAKPSLALVRAVVFSFSELVRAEGHKWIEAKRNDFLADSELIAGLCVSEHADNRAFASNLLRSSVLPENTARVLVGRLVAILQTLKKGDEARVKDVADIMLKGLGKQLAVIGEPVIRDLLAHEMPEVQELAGDILLAHSELANKVPDDILFMLLDSRHEPVRGVGARLLGQLPEDQLAKRVELIARLTSARVADLRNSIRPIIQRLSSNAQFCEELCDELVPVLLKKEQGDGIHSHILAVLKDDVRGGLSSVPKEGVLTLLRSQYAQAQELGGILLASNVPPSELSVREIVNLASHEIQSVRAACWKMSEGSIDRLKDDMGWAIRLLDAKWDDSRKWAREFFRKTFTQDELTPDILVAICDSVVKDVQSFGKELITQYFLEEHGLTYLTKLSEHPSPSLQLFATAWLEGYASGDLERLEELSHYFKSILSRVNKGGVAKVRVLSFLEKEALADPKIARYVVDLYTRQSVTIAITHKHAMIESLLAIHRAYPDMSVPLRVKEVEVRRGV